MHHKLTASVVFYHGTGDTGPSLRGWVRALLGRDFNGSHIKFVYPTASRQRYKPYDNELARVWFNRTAIEIGAAEDRASLSQAYIIARQLIQNELDRGIPVNRILVGGFSMGGAMALHTAYHLNRDLAGVFVHSGFLNRDSLVYESLAGKRNLPDIWMFHGEDDEVVKFKWGRETFDELQKYGVKGRFMALDDTEHELTKSSLLELEQWIHLKLPEAQGEQEKESES